MGLNILKNEKKSNHLSCLEKMATQADTLIIVSPFVADDISKLLNNISTIKKITLYTTLQKYDDTARKAISLYKFYKYCREKSIELLIKIDDNLHGKVYLFYNGSKPKGFVITSGNFTENGLLNNHEYGLCVEDEKMQQEMADIIMSINTYDLSYIQLCEIYNDALKFIEKHPLIQQEKFKININIRPSAPQNKDVKYYITQRGTTENPFNEQMTLNNKETFTFRANSKDPNKKIKKGDILLISGVGSLCIVGYYRVISDEPYEEQNCKDRWPWKVKAECCSPQLRSSWRDYKLKTQDLVAEFKQKKPEEHITTRGGDTLGALQYGLDKIQITKEFAQFVIGKIPD